MEDNKELVTENVTENVEEPSTEEVVESTQSTKTYSENDFEVEVNKRVDELLGQKISRNNKKIRKEYADKYGKLENVLRSGTGESDLDAITKKLEEFYEEEGIKIPRYSKYSEEEVEQLYADKEANEIISNGYQDIVEEVDRLANKGLENMTAKERIIFNKLASERKAQETNKELNKLGLTDNKEFKDFAEKLNPKLTVKEKYDMYKSLTKKEEPEIKQMGSMVSTKAQNEIKEFYTVEEARRFTKSDYDKNPKLLEAVEKSMSKWK